MRYIKYTLTIVFLAFSISCTTAANGNQANANLPDGVSSAASSSASNDETSARQNTTPDAIVKELYKLHDADKSPLYKAKDRAAMEKYFAEDFVDLVWVGGKEPNLMNKLAVEGDALYGTSGVGKAKNLNVGKPQINGDKAIVTADFETAEEDAKYEKKSAIYEMVKEKAGWRIADVKINGFYSGSLIETVKNLKKTGVESDKEIDAEFTIIKPPFVGTRSFVTDPAGSGIGTPRYYLTINAENYMFCGFEQTNQADGTETKEEIPLGRFKKIFECNFKDETGGKHKYKVEGNYIYELDKDNQVIKSEDCCPSGSESDKQCECKGAFTK